MILSPSSRLLGPFPFPFWSDMILLLLGLCKRKTTSSSTTSTDHEVSNVWSEHYKRIIMVARILFSLFDSGLSISRPDCTCTTYNFSFLKLKKKNNPFIQPSLSQEKKTNAKRGGKWRLHTTSNKIVKICLHYCYQCPKPNDGLRMCGGNIIPEESSRMTPIYISSCKQFKYPRSHFI